MKAKRPPTRNTAAQLQRLAQDHADEQARHIPWQRLLDTRKQYVDWQEFCLWVRSIHEIEGGGMPEWLWTIVDQRCPGFLQGVDRRSSTRLLGQRLEDWMDEHIFDFARKEGWFNAVQFYAVRDPRYQRAEVCWAECVKKWAQARPKRYPSLGEWQAIAAACDETAHLLPEHRKAQASARVVGRERLEEAIARYIDWEAFAYWARPALEYDVPIPDSVREELEHRCPGLLMRSVDAGNKPAASIWEGLMAWIAERFFAESKAEGWFAAILVGVRRHPRATRTMEFADHWDEIRGPDLPVPYPTFDDWRRDADAYVESETD